jgi:hypothetical protein
VNVHGRMLSGPVPPWATGAVVIDDRGDEHAATITDGVWTANVDASEQLVRFTDAPGELLALPLPEGARTRVRDAPEACPVCAAVAWVMVGNAVVCERCGHVAGTASRESVGGGTRIAFQVGGFGAGAEDDEDEEVPDAERFTFDAQAFLRKQTEALAAVPFPVYAVAGRAASAGGRYDDDFHDDNRSPGGMLVAFAHRERSARRRVARAEPIERALVIDGRAEPFVFLGVDDAWVATREHGDVDVMVSARAIDPDGVALEPLADPANAWAGTIGDAERAAERVRRDAAGELLTRAEVERLIDRHDLTEHRDKVLAAIRPGYWLVPGDAPRTRIGGLPDLAPGELWPHGDDGIPYTFVAQIDCSTLPPIASEFPIPEWGHGDALVRIFAALDARVPEPGPAVALACPAGAPVARAELPPRPDPLPADAWEPDDDALRMLHELPVRLVPFLSARIAWYAGIPTEASGDYDEFARRLAAGGDRPRDHQWQTSHLLGHGETLQGEDPTTTGELKHPDVPRDEWCTLINIPDHQDMSFGDGGGLAIVIPRADLSAGRYDRLVTNLSMY